MIRVNILVFFRNIQGSRTEQMDADSDEMISIRAVATISNDEVHWIVIAELDAEEGGFEEQQVLDGNIARIF